MNIINKIINKCGVSKVRVAKYLGVSRQMLYNYLAFERIEDIPKDKLVKLYSLLGVQSESEIGNILITDDYINEMENRLNDEINESYGRDNLRDLKGLNRKEQEILINIFNILKDKMQNDEKNDNVFNTMRYLYMYLQVMEQVPELKYLLAYMAKSNGFIDPLEFIYDEDKQYMFEGILYSAMMLYSGNGASKAKVAESHKKFEMEIEHKKEEKLSKTQKLNILQQQALMELGYTVINEGNAKEVIEKIAEIMSREF